jgi:hypothetical protein
MSSGIAVLNSVRYKNPTPNPLPASREGAIEVPHVIRKRYSRERISSHPLKLVCLSTNIMAQYAWC